MAPLRSTFELRATLTVDEVEARLRSLVEASRPLGLRKALTLVGIIDGPTFRLRALLLYHRLGAGCWLTGEIRQVGDEALVLGEVTPTHLEFFWGLLALGVSVLALIRRDTAIGLLLLVFPALVLFDLWLTTRLLARMVNRCIGMPSASRQVAV